MKNIFLAVIGLLLANYSFAQHVYQIRADSVRIYSTCDTAELILENRTRDTLGFLYNKGDGRTEFRKLRLVSLGNMTIAIEGQDTLQLDTNGFILNQYQAPQPGGLWVTDSVRATLGRFINGVFVGSSGFNTGLTGSGTNAIIQAGGFDKIRVNSGTTGNIDMQGVIRNHYSTAFRIDTTTATATSMSGNQTTLLVNNLNTQDTVVLPPVTDAWMQQPSVGRIYHIKKISRNNFPVLVTASTAVLTDSIEGKRKDTLFHYGDALTVQAQKGHWRVLSRYNAENDHYIKRQSAISTVTGSATLTENDRTVIVQNTGNATLSLPDANTCQGCVYTIKKISAAGNSITIDPSGSQQIDGALTKSFDVQYYAVTIQANGGAWYIINAYMASL
ncbi:hypothetical protein [Chitinophaga japonensis]|uniref:Uncharacterized protein n=1 Tax=Chitinophaga japonensis TaxID=104662 RepID=A0A562T5R3_CHIJA|nr:hypothetical protein [Chitinophaga japonensis]TWI88879.1 hypothetical protein LX66_2967 [Chitinophaga japonensis]